MEEFLATSLGQLSLAVAITCISALAAWYGFARIKDAQRTRHYRAFLYGVSEAKSPLRFKTSLRFLTIWAAGLAAISIISTLHIVDALMRLIFRP